MSIPVQRRLSEATVDDLVHAYREGSSIDSLAALFGVNRTTVISHLDRRNIAGFKVPERKIPLDLVLAGAVDLGVRPTLRRRKDEPQHLGA